MSGHRSTISAAFAAALAMRSNALSFMGLAVLAMRQVTDERRSETRRAGSLAAAWNTSFTPSWSPRLNINTWEPVPGGTLGSNFDPRRRELLRWRRLRASEVASSPSHSQSGARKRRFRFTHMQLSRCTVATEAKLKVYSTVRCLSRPSPSVVSAPMWEGICNHGGCHHAFIVLILTTASAIALTAAANAADMYRPAEGGYKDTPFVGSELERPVFRCERRLRLGR